MENEKFLDHARNPRNTGLLEDANVVVQASDSECDDKQIFFIRIQDDAVKSIRFLIEGCETTVATASAVTEMVEGQSLDALLALTDRSISEALQSLPEEKMHCAAMAALAMHTTVHQYRNTAKGEASYKVQDFENSRIVAQVLNQPLAQVYSSGYDF